MEGSAPNGPSVGATRPVAGPMVVGLCCPNRNSSSAELLAPMAPHVNDMPSGAVIRPVVSPTVGDDLIEDLMAKQARLSALLDRVTDVREAITLVCLHSQNAARLGKLMLNKKALQKDAEDPFQEALNEVLDELAEELDLKLG